MCVSEKYISRFLAVTWQKNGWGYFFLVLYAHICFWLYCTLDRCAFSARLQKILHNNTGCLRKQILSKTPFSICSAKFVRSRPEQIVNFTIFLYFTQTARGETNPHVKMTNAAAGLPFLVCLRVPFIFREVNFKKMPGGNVKWIAGIWGVFLLNTRENHECFFFLRHVATWGVSVFFFSGILYIIMCNIFELSKNIRQNMRI